MKIRLLVLSFLALNASMMMPVDALAASKSQPVVAPLVQIASGSAMVVDLKTHEVIYSRDPDQVRPIASLTKLMTAMVTLDARQPLDEVISVDIHNTPEMRGVFSRVKLNSEITRRQMIQLALMSSENRAAASLAAHYPGGYDAFIRAMNAKAKELGMTHTHYVEPTGLSIHNVSTARDLTRLLMATRMYPLIGELSTTQEKTAVFSHPSYALPFRNTNHLIMNPKWSIQVTKTGYTDERGTAWQCVRSSMVNRSRWWCSMLSVSSPPSLMPRACVRGWKLEKACRCRRLPRYIVRKRISAAPNLRLSRLPTRHF